MNEPNDEVWMVTWNTKEYPKGFVADTPASHPGYMVTKNHVEQFNTEMSARKKYDELKYEDNVGIYQCDLKDNKTYISQKMKEKMRDEKLEKIIEKIIDEAGTESEAECGGQVDYVSDDGNGTDFMKCCVCGRVQTGGDYCDNKIIIKVKD